MVLKKSLPRFFLSIFLIVFIASCSCERQNEVGAQKSSIAPVQEAKGKISEEAMQIIKEKDEALASLSKDIDSLRAAIVSKDGAIVELNAQLEAMHSNNKSLMESLSEVKDSHKSTKVRLYVLVALLVASLILNVILILLFGKAKSNSNKELMQADNADDISSAEDASLLPKRGRGRPKGSFKRVEEEAEAEVEEAALPKAEDKESSNS